MFHSIRPENPDFNALKSEKELSSSMGKWKSTHNSLCYSAVIGSYYQQGQKEMAMQYYEECRHLGIFPSFPESMMIAHCHEVADTYKTQLEEWEGKKPATAGIPAADVYEAILFI